MSELCMLAEVGELDTIPKGWKAEGKLDGTRCILVGNRLIGRRGNEYTQMFPELKIEFNGILDGEIIVENEKGISDFSLIQLRSHIKDKQLIAQRSKQYPAKFVVFDIMKLGDKNLTKIPLMERIKHIPAKFDNERVVNINTLPIPSWNEVIEKGLEGLMVKNPNGVYEFARSKNWLKIKNRKEITIIFTGFEENNAGLCLTNEDGIRCQCAGEQSKPVKQALMQSGSIRAEIEYYYKTKEGKYFQPTFKRLIEV